MSSYINDHKRQDESEATKIEANLMTHLGHIVKRLRSGRRAGSHALAVLDGIPMDACSGGTLR